jgi:hypothetical protein
VLTAAGTAVSAAAGEYAGVAACNAATGAVACTIAGAAASDAPAGTSAEGAVDTGETVVARGAVVAVGVEAPVNPVEDAEAAGIPAAAEPTDAALLTSGCADVKA